MTCPLPSRLLSSNLRGRCILLCIKCLRTSNRLSPFQDSGGVCACLCPRSEPQQGWGRGQDAFGVLGCLRLGTRLACLGSGGIQALWISLSSTWPLLPKSSLRWQELPSESQANAQTQNVNEWDRQKHFRISKSDTKWLSPQSCHWESGKPDSRDVGTSPVCYREVLTSLCSVLLRFWLEY